MILWLCLWNFYFNTVHQAHISSMMSLCYRVSTFWTPNQKRHCRCCRHICFRQQIAHSIVHISLDFRLHQRALPISPMVFHLLLIFVFYCFLDSYYIQTFSFILVEWVFYLLNFSKMLWNLTLDARLLCGVYLFS